MNPKQALQLVDNMGLRYVKYRVTHELEKRLGTLEKRHPMNPQRKTLIYLDEWRKNAPKFLFNDRNSISLPTLGSSSLEALKKDAQRILRGEIRFFSAEWKDLGSDYDWITNLETGYQYDIKKHWSSIQDIDSTSGDIKYVWEKSRFSYLFTIIRYDYYFDEDHSEFVFDEINSWIQANPINQGPNWRCSQEISLRTINWFFALYFYKDSKNLSESIFQNIIQNTYWALHHVYNHIEFSRIAVRNNHAITETLFLALSNHLFPFIKHTKKCSADGRKWFEEEIAYQIYDDGTFLQFSMNYHRVVIQLLSFGIKLSEIHKNPFSDIVYDRAHKSVNFLYQCLQDQNGNLPNYGSNDGALFFPLSQTDYRDYRPQLAALHTILTNAKLFSTPQLNEESNWLTQTATDNKSMPAIKKQYGAQAFLKSGYFILREKDTFTFIRCGSHKDRPAQADNLHIDIWYKGKNILRDAGSYKYNTTPELLKYFVGTSSHNTVTVENSSQMQKGGRFIWYYWTQAMDSKWTETDDAYIFTGKISAFRYMDGNASHQRIIKKFKNSERWIVQDFISNLDGKTKQQIWNIADPIVKLESNGIETSGKAAYSSYYGLKTDYNSTIFEFDDKISTTLTIAE